MLKFQINKNNFKSDIVPIDFFDIEFDEMSIENEFGEEIGNTEKNIVTCYYSNSQKINAGDKVIFKYTKANSDGIDETITQESIVEGADESEHSFTCMADRYIRLDANTFSYGKTSEYIEETDQFLYGYYVYINLGGYHFCDSNEYPNGVTVYWMDDNGALFELIGEPFGDRCIRFPLSKKTELTYDGDDSEELNFVNGVNEEIDYYNRGVGNNIVMAIRLFKFYGLIDNSENDWEAIVEALFTDNVLSQEYSVAPFSFRLYNFIFGDTTETDLLTVGLLKPSLSIPIALTSKDSTDLHQETDVSENFVEVEKKKAINEYTEMEKDVYLPVVNTSSGEKRVTEIHFNLHFRKRIGDDWKIEKGGFWNGVKVEGGHAELMGKSNEDTYGYFSFNDINSQSDLLTYANFSDSDVKYQKNTLKKSFLRLSFFDSTKPTNQILLCYSTIFTDTGGLFSKYMRNFSNPKVPSNSFGFSRLTSDDNGTTKKKLSGSRTNREPYWSNGSYPTDDNQIESMRLSSRFTVKDKYTSNSSSEGFYLYLWKDLWKDDNGEYAPTDIYMRVEFNHAGFGRTIPFMLPYNKENNKIKSFDEIVQDFNEPNGGYGIREYIRYSYIHFKYVKTEDGRYVYYPAYDSSSISFENGILNINLYEAKLRDADD